MLEYNSYDLLQTVCLSRALNYTIQNKDLDVQDTILNEIKKCFNDDKQSAIQFLKSLIPTNQKSGEVIAKLKKLYPQTYVGHYVIPFLQLLPLVPKVISTLYDNTSDALLAAEYHRLANPSLHDVPANHQYSSNVAYAELNVTACLEQTLPAEQYKVAECYTISGILLMMYLNGMLLANEFMEADKFKHNPYRENKYVQYVVIMLMTLVICPLISPFYVFVMYIFIMYNQFKINQEYDELKKSQLVNEQWNRQLVFGYYQVMECVESSLQMLLQIWLVAAKYNCYYKMGIAEILKRALVGAIFMFDSATSTDDKTMGKLLIAFVSLCMSGLAVYKRSKREAVSTWNSIFLLASIVCQVSTNLLCLIPLYYLQRNWLGLFLPIAIHYVLIGLAKLLFDPAYHLAQNMNRIIPVVNTLGSLMINITAAPSKGYWKNKKQKQERKAREKQENRVPNEANRIENGEAKLLNNPDEDNFRTAYHNPPTVMVHLLFFVIRTMGNIVIIAIAIYLYGVQQKISTFSIGVYLGVAFGLLTPISWLFHTTYYLFYGHPWKDSNGPKFGNGFFNLTYHFCGVQRQINLGTGMKQEKTNRVKEFVRMIVTIYGYDVYGA